MIPNLLPFHVALGFVAGWLLVAGVTYVADKYGTGKAGLVGALPSTGAVSLLFIGLTQSKDAAIHATAIFPLGFSITFAFLLFYAYPNHMTFWPRLGIALLLWTLLSAVVALSGFDNFYLSLLGSVLMSSVVYYVHRSRRIKDTHSAATKPSVWSLTFKGVLGGCVVSAVVIASAYGGPLVGGVAGSAPAIWTSSLIIARPHSPSRGIEFSRSLTKSFLRVGVLTIIPFYVAVRYILAIVNTGSSVADLCLGTLLAYLVISPLAWAAWYTTPRSKDEAREA